MLNRDKIISLAWLKLGDQNQLYNTNISERQKIAGMLFDEVRQEVATDTTFLFNAVEITPTKNLQEKDGEFFRYNKPVDFLNFVRSSDREAKFIGEFIYSTDKDLKLVYCRDMALSEFPDYLHKFFIVSLALKLSEAYITLQANDQKLIMERMHEMNRIVTSEGLPFSIKR